jgi:hypothetical protein
MRSVSSSIKLSMTSPFSVNGWIRLAISGEFAAVNAMMFMHS